MPLRLGTLPALPAGFSLSQSRPLAAEQKLPSPVKEKRDGLPPPPCSEGRNPCGGRSWGSPMIPTTCLTRVRLPGSRQPWHISLVLGNVPASAPCAARAHVPRCLQHPVPSPFPLRTMQPRQGWGNPW